MSLLRRGLERRALNGAIDPFLGGRGISVPSNGELGPVSAGVVVNDASALGLSAVYACVQLLADSIASLPWDAYRKREGLREEISPAPSLLRDPFPDISVFDWKHMVVSSLALRGNFFGLVTGRDRLEYPTAIQPLHPDDVRIDRDPDTGAKRVWLGGQTIPRADLFHIPGFRMPGADLGLSPIGLARHTIGLGIAAEQYGAKWFNDGAAPSSVLETSQNLTPDQVRQTQQTWIASHGGRRKPAVLTGGFTWKPITIAPDESQFIETRKFQVTDVARIYRVPPHMIGDVEKSTSWGTGIEQQSIGFVTYTLRSWLTRFEEAMSRVTPAGQYVKFNVDGLLRGDIKARYDAYKIALDGGWRNPDEVRALEDLPPIPGGLGQGYRQPMNFAPLGYDPTTAAPTGGDPDVP